MKKIVQLTLILLLITAGISFADSSGFNVNLESNIVNNSFVKGNIVSEKNTFVVTYKCISEDGNKLITLGEIKSNNFTIELMDNLESGKYKIIFSENGNKIEKSFSYVKNPTNNVKAKFNQKEFYIFDTVKLSGSIESPLSEYVTLKVTNKEGTRIVTVSQIKLLGNKFDFNLGKFGISDIGKYKITLKNGSLIKNYEFEVKKYKEANHKKKKKNTTVVVNDDIIPSEAINMDISLPGAIKSILEDSMKSFLKKIMNSKEKTAGIRKINKSINDELKKLDFKNGSSIVDKQTNLVRTMMFSANVDISDAKIMVKDLITTNVKTLFSKSEFDKKDKKVNTRKVSKSLSRLIEKLIEKSGRIALTDNMALVSDKNEKYKNKKSYKIDKNLLTDSIKNILETKKEMLKTLSDSNLNDMILHDQYVNISLPKSNDSEALSLELDPNAIQDLRDNKLGITVKSKDVSFMIPSSLMGNFSNSIKLQSSNVSSEKRKVLNKKTNNGLVKELKTLDLSAETNGEKIKNKVKLSFSLDTLEDVDLNKLMVGVFENGKWTKLSYEVVDNEVEFMAPHFSVYSLMSFENNFEDTRSNWAVNYINSLTAKGIVNGKSDMRFDPNSNITRAEFAKILVTYLGLDDKITTNFKDVKKDKWYYDITALAGMNGISYGSSKGNFYPEADINRNDMAMMISKAYYIKNGYELTGESSVFDDDSLLNAESKKAIYALRANNIISGYEDNTFRPNDTATRAEAVKIMYEFIKY
ncbi:S-layer homology domain-containing protein [Helicovermis profundi]|uniref:SLH domain-containing protein n=1 Tax=Helicovermis profundi TaxID=3065157 RepID=A0AAU9EK68_9FIRM|nr:hypothetical protein HLPR_23040 [Clostridia bacterium S502]